MGSGNVGDSSLFTGKGTPWGGGADRKPIENSALFSGTGTPWGAVDDRGSFGGLDPSQSALFTGAGTPWSRGNTNDLSDYLGVLGEAGLGALAGLAAGGPWGAAAGGAAGLAHGGSGLDTGGENRIQDEQSEKKRQAASEIERQRLQNLDTQNRAIARQDESNTFGNSFNQNRQQSLDLAEQLRRAQEARNRRGRALNY